MKRRQFLVAAGGAAAAIAAPPSNAIVLYEGRSVAVTNTTLTTTASGAKDLWIATRDLPRINEFEVKPQGACRGDICIPISKDLKSGDRFNLTGFSRRIHQASAADSGVWSFGAIPVMRGAFLESRIAPDFAIPDRNGRIVHLHDFRGKKLLLVTWASW